jgi:hypothetical protein
MDQRGVARPQGSGCDIGAFELIPASGTIGSAGGILELATATGVMTMDVPAEALSQDTTLSLTENQGASGFGVSKGLSGTLVQSIAAEPEGQTFSQPVTVTISWNDRDGTSTGDSLPHVDLGTCLGGTEEGESCQSALAVQVLPLQRHLDRYPLRTHPTVDPYLDRKGLPNFQQTYRRRSGTRPRRRRTAIASS